MLRFRLQEHQTLGSTWTFSFRDSWTKPVHERIENVFDILHSLLYDNSTWNDVSCFFDIKKIYISAIMNIVDFDGS